MKRKIVASLTYGKKKTIFNYLVILFVILPMYVAGFYWLVQDAQKGNVGTIALLVLLLLFTPGFIYAMYALIQEYRRIRLWEKDGVELTALSSTPEDGVIFTKDACKIKIRVEFFYEGEKHVQVSGEKWPHIKWMVGDVAFGYDEIFKKYEEREIKILYSPKYDEVLILKD